MSVGIPVGTVVTYQSDNWHTSFFGTAGDTLSSVETRLTQDGFRTELGAETTAGVLGTLEEAIPGHVQFSVVLPVRVVGGTGYEKADDVASIINHEVWQVTGILPSAWRITSIALPAPGSAGEPTARTQCGSGLIEGIKSFLGLCEKPSAPATEGSFLDRLESKTVLYVGLAIFGFVAALALIGYSGTARQRL